LLATMLVAACGGGSSPSAPGPAPSPGDLVQVAPDRRGHGAGIDRSAALLPARPSRAGPSFTRPTPPAAAISTRCSSR